MQRWCNSYIIAFAIAPQAIYFYKHYEWRDTVCEIRKTNSELIQFNSEFVLFYYCPVNIDNSLFDG